VPKVYIKVDWFVAIIAVREWDYFSIHLSRNPGEPLEDPTIVCVIILGNFTHSEVATEEDLSIEDILRSETLLDFSPTPDHTEVGLA